MGARKAFAAKDRGDCVMERFGRCGNPNPKARAEVTRGADTTKPYNITTEDELKQALIRLLGDVSISVTPPMVAAAMGEALAAFLEEEMS